jgi:hypothetical protein
LQIRALVGDEHKTAAISVVVLITAMASLLAAPWIGVLSDRCTFSIGKRRPFMLLGTFICIFGLMNQGMAAPHLPPEPAETGGCNATLDNLGTAALNPGDTHPFHITLQLLWFLISHITLAIGLLMIEIPFNGLVADVVSPTQRGEVSSYIGVGAILGAITGSIIGIFYRELTPVGSFALAAGLLLLATLLGSCLQEEDASRRPASAAAEAKVLTLAGENANAPSGKEVEGPGAPATAHNQPLSHLRLMMKPFSTPGFTWLFLSRFLAMMGIQTMCVCSAMPPCPSPPPQTDRENSRKRQKEWGGAKCTPWTGRGAPTRALTVYTGGPTSSSGSPTRLCCRLGSPQSEAWPS